MSAIEGNLQQFLPETEYSFVPYCQICNIPLAVDSLPPPVAREIEDLHILTVHLQLDS